MSYEMLQGLVIAVSVMGVVLSMILAICAKDGEVLISGVFLTVLVVLLCVIMAPSTKGHPSHAEDNYISTAAALEMNGEEKVAIVMDRLLALKERGARIDSEELSKIDLEAMDLLYSIKEGKSEEVVSSEREDVISAVERALY